MPELPEVETVRRTLAARAGDRLLEEILWLDPRVLKDCGPEAFRALLPGHRIVRYGRRGKYLLLEMDHGPLLVVHLGMTGQMLVVSPGDPVQPHTHLRIRLEGDQELRFRDVRRFGRLRLIPSGDPGEVPGLARMGPEPLDPDFTEEAWLKHLEGRRGTLKTLLLSQHFLAGIGNIYADESLFDAGLHPLRDLESLSREEKVRLYHSIRHILKEAVGAGGSSIRDYVDSRGRQGSYQQAHRVYGRGGQNCMVCGTLLEACRLGGRTTVYCPCCQKEMVK